MSMKQAENTTERSTAGGAMASDLKKALGIDVGDLAKDLTKDYLKDQLLGRKSTPVTRSKFSKALDAVASFSRSVWWIPAAGYLAIGVAVILVKLMAKMVGV